MKRFCTALCLFFLIFSLIPISAGAVTVEQVHPVMPVIDLYVHQNDHDLSALTLEDITATLDGEPLTVTSLAPSDQGVYYVFMLDISGSIPGYTFRAACNVIEDLHSKLREGDQLSVITFGEEVKHVIKGNETTEQVRKILGNLHATDQSTCFNEAMIELVKVASAKQNMRRVAVMISDAVEDPGKYPPSKTPQSDVEAALRESGVAVYGMAVDSRTAVLDRFRSFCELTGGKVALFHEHSAQTAFDSLKFTNDQIWHLSLAAKNNLVDEETHKLTVQFGELSTLETEIRPTQWHRDTEKPTLVSHEIDFAAKTIRLEVSEPLSNMEDPASYLLRNAAGEETNPETLEASGTVILLTCPQLTEDPGWTLTSQNLADISMEANPLTITLALTPAVVPTQPAAPAAPEEAPAAPAAPEEAPAAPAAPEPFPIFVVAGIGLVLLLIVLLVVLKKKGGLNVSPKPGKTAANSKNAREVSFVFEEPDKK